jgi:hypothetical protein
MRVVRSAGVAQLERRTARIVDPKKAAKITATPSVSAALVDRAWGIMVPES